MEVNRTFWDGSTITYSESGAERVTVLADKLWTKIQASPEKYVGKEWDKSICPWKIGDGSDLFKSMWCLPYANLENQFTFASSPFYKERKKGYTFYLSCNGTPKSGERPGNKSNGVATNPVWLGTLSRGDIDLDDTVTANWLSLKAGDINPVINFDYSNIFVVPMFYNSANVGFYITSNTETTWNANDVYGLGFIFYQKQADGTSSTVTAIDIISLNNKIDKPSWTVTNSWNEDTMFDNTLALQKYLSWDGGYEISSYTAIGTHLQTGDTYIDGANYPGNGYNYDNPKLATDDAAGSVYYIANKQMSISAPTTDSDIWEDEFTPVYLGAEYNFGIHRHLKSTVTFSQFIDYVKRQLAYLGFRFCVYAEDVSKNINSEYYYIPEINEKGVTTGNYYAANSTEAQSLPNNSWNTDVYEQTPYDGTDDDEDEDPNTYSDETDWHFDIVSPNSSFIKLYLLDQLRVESLHDKFYESLQSKPSGMSTEEFFSDTYLTNNPTDVIISLRYFNINLENAINTSPTAEEIKLGAYQTGISAKQPVQTTKLFDYGSCIYYPHFGDFRDYAPYSSAQLIIPYCGTVDIDPAQYMNTTINVKMLIDFASGACTAYILRNNLVIDSISGQIGIDLPVTGVASQDLLRNLFNGSQNLKAAKNANVQGMAAGAMGFISSALSGNYMGMASAAMNTMFNEENTMLQKETADFNLHHTNVPFRQIGAVDPMISTNQEQQCRLLVYRPIMGIESQEEYDSYAHTIGYACYDNAQLSGYTGFTVCAAADTSGIPATLKERAIIKQLLLSGIYL